MALKPIGFKPDGSHINKGALFVVVAVLIQPESLREQ